MNKKACYVKVHVQIIIKFRNLIFQSEIKQWSKIEEKHEQNQYKKWKN